MSQAGTYISSVGPGGPVATLTGNTGGAVSPSGGNINVVGDATTVNVAGNPGTHTLTISASGSLSNSFVTGSGTATPVAGVLNVPNGSNINTTGSGNTLTVNLVNSPSVSGSVTAGTGFTATTGDVNIIAGNLDIPQTDGAATKGMINVNGVRWLSTPATHNVYLGANAGGFGGGNLNTAVGDQSANAGVGGLNTSIGYQAYFLGTGSTNTIVGAQALKNSNTTSSSNIAVGFQAGNAYTTTESNNILIGNVGVIAENNTLRIGTSGSGSGQQNRCFVAGVDGVSVGSTAQVVTEVSGQLGSAVITAGTNISVTPTANVITIATSGSVANSFVTGSGTATPSAGVLNVPNGSNINTTGSGSTLTVNLVNSPSVSGSVTAGTDIITTAGDFISSSITASDLSRGALKIGGSASSNTVLHTFDATGGITNFFSGYSSGNPSLMSNLSRFNIGVGTLSLSSLTSGASNTATGYGSLRSLTTGFSNCAFGDGSLGNNTSGSDNTAIGLNALSLLPTGSNNTCVGSSTMNNAFSGSDNTSIGYFSLNAISSGSSNIAIGSQAGISYNLGESSNIVIGNSGSSGESNVIRIGTSGSGSGQQNKCFIAGIDGVNVGSTAQVVTEVSGQLGSAVITAGTNISVTPGANTITIATTGSAAFSWNVVTGATQALAVNNGYFANNAGTCVMTLPATAAVGDTIRVAGMNNATGWQIAQNAGQTIHTSSISTTTGTGGSLQSTSIYDCVELVCNVANTSFAVQSSMGNITIV